MRFSCGIAQQKDALQIALAKSRPDWTDGQPGIFQPRARQRFTHAAAVYPDMLQNSFSRLAIRRLTPDALQIIAPYATGKTYAFTVAMHHPPIPSGENQQRH